MCVIMFGSVCFVYVSLYFVQLLRRSSADHKSTGAPVYKLQGALMSQVSKPDSAKKMIHDSGALVPPSPALGLGTNKHTSIAMPP